MMTKAGWKRTQQKMKTEKKKINQKQSQFEIYVQKKKKANKRKGNRSNFFNMRKRYQDNSNLVRTNPMLNEELRHKLNPDGLNERLPEWHSDESDTEEETPRDRYFSDIPTRNRRRRHPDEEERRERNRRRRRPRPRKTPQSVKATRTALYSLAAMFMLNIYPIFMFSFGSWFLAKNISFLNYCLYFIPEYKESIFFYGFMCCIYEYFCENKINEGGPLSVPTGIPIWIVCYISIWYICIIAAPFLYLLVLLVLLEESIWQIRYIDTVSKIMLTATWVTYFTAIGASSYKAISAYIDSSYIEIPSYIPIGLLILSLIMVIIVCQKIKWETWNEERINNGH